jgi:phage shock protein A
MANPVSYFFGVLGRLFQSGSEKIVDPTHALERAYSQQLQALDETRKGRLEVETIGARLDLELRQLGDGIGACEDQARRALLAGRDDLARVSLGRCEELREQFARTQLERERLDEERRGLHQQETELAGAVQAFRSRKEVLKAQYGATRARLRVGEALTGYSRTVTTVGDDVRRFEDRLLTLQARARALETVAIGPAVGSVMAPASVERELTIVTVSPRIEQEMARLRGELSLGSDPALPGASSNGARPEHALAGATVDGALAEQQPQPEAAHAEQSQPEAARTEQPRVEVTYA